jgi:hypothetical protein
MNFNEDGNLLGRVFALALIAAAVIGVGRAGQPGACPLGLGGCLFTLSPDAPAASPVSPPAAPR